MTAAASQQFRRISHRTDQPWSSSQSIPLLVVMTHLPLVIRISPLEAELL